MVKMNLKFKISFEQLIMIFKEFNYIEPSNDNLELADPR
jgi:hypothetical protein